MGVSPAQSSNSSSALTRIIELSAKVAQVLPQHKSSPDVASATKPRSGGTFVLHFRQSVGRKDGNVVELVGAVLGSQTADDIRNHTHRPSVLGRDLGPEEAIFQRQ